MSTNGIYGFRKNNADKLTYNHSDSYPSYLGNNIVKFIRSSTEKELNDIYDQIILVDHDSIPTQEQIEECHKYFNASISTQKETEWYCLLRNAQGDLDVYKKGLKYMTDDHNFIKNSLHCEYGYIINLDSMKLEIYKGYQHEPNNNRYATEPYVSGKTKYYNCKLIHEFDLFIPRNWMEYLGEDE